MSTDPLTRRYIKMGMVQQFHVEKYVRAWYKLALDCEIDGRFAMAETCRDRAEYYGGLMMPMYRREHTGVSHVDLVPVEMQ